MLSDYFTGVVVKRLSAVEADTTRSNQHEYNGTKELKSIFGLDQPRKYETRFLWVGDEQESVGESGFITWYDARADHPTRSEYRLYFPTTPVSEMAKEGDVLFIARRTNDQLLVVITAASSTMQNQLMWLFGISDQPGFAFEAQEISGNSDAQLDFAATLILDELGIEPEEPESDNLDALVAVFGLQFPKTSELSRLARESLPDVDARDNPDSALVAWLDREEQLFRRLERRIVEERLRTGFDVADVDGFLGFSLSVQNRRKSRAGRALENHLETVFLSHQVRCARGAKTEHRNRPDFLFPGQAEYADPSFPETRLTMLGAKSTLKDRWRQVLSEAERIPVKHLLTIEPSLSENQTNEMQAKHCQLVVPKSLHATYKTKQQNWLLSLRDFVELVRSRQ